MCIGLHGPRVCVCVCVCVTVFCPSHQMPVLMAATAASDKPVDGYLINDIISIFSLTVHNSAYLCIHC